MREVVSLVFGIRDAKLTIAKDEEGKVDFFLPKTVGAGGCCGGGFRRNGRGTP